MNTATTTTTTATTATTTTKAKPKVSSRPATIAKVEKLEKTDIHDTPSKVDVQPTQTGDRRRPGMGSTALEPIRRPPDDASPEEFAAYRKAKRGRRIFKANRTARIVRRETPHDTKTCRVCVEHPPRESYEELTPREIAKRGLVSRSQVYRVLSDDPKQARGRRTLATLRRIAHDGMGISLDELAALVLD